ncbi:MAG TPA: hypothetical protein VGB50_00725 [Flavobacterium sp.]|jgi:hypothetical protein
MKTNFLFPPQFRKIGWLIFVPALIAGTVLMTAEYADTEGFLDANVLAIFNQDPLGDSEAMVIIKNGISDEILLTLIIIGGLMAGFSKHRNEDEFIAKIRYESLVWAVYFNFGVMLFATLFVYGLFYYHVMIANMFTVLFFFIIRFHFMLYKQRKSLVDEE